MSEWVLILVLWRGGNAIEHIPGFADLAACQKAGDVFVAHIKDELASRPAYVCVERPTRETPR